MARTDNLTNYLTDVITAVKNKKGSQDTINAANLDTEIANLPSGETYPFDVNSLLISKQSATDSDVATIASYVNTMDYSKIYLDDSAFYNSTFVDGSSMAGINVVSGSNSKLAIKSLVVPNPSMGGNYGSYFYFCQNMTIPPYIDFSECLNYRRMFYNCPSLVSFPSGYFDSMPKRFEMVSSRMYGTYPPISCTGMFHSCTSLTSVDFSSTIYPVVTNNMFELCVSLTSVSHLDLSLSMSVNSLFKGCENLTTIDFTDFSETANVGAVFGGCFNLTDASLDNALLALSTVTLDARRSLTRVFSAYGNTPPYNNDKYKPTYAFAERVRASQYYQTCIDAGWTDDLPTS